MESISSFEFFLQLIRLGIGNDDDVTVPETIDWEALKKLAGAHGLSAVVYAGIEKCSSDFIQTLPRSLKLKWFGSVFHNYEQRYQRYVKAISSLAGFYNQHGYKMMVLKGYACSLDWPNPKHRPCGDIDIWQFGEYQEADAAISAENGIKIDSSHHHHTVFRWQGFMVENHYDFINVHHHKSNAEFEKLLKEQAKDDSHYVELNGERVYIPSPNLHALFLLRHAMSEFAATGINIRQLLDWAFFVKAHRDEVNWAWLEEILEEFRMKRLYDIFNAICVNNLGFANELFPKGQFDPNLKDKVLNEILCPSIPNEKPHALISRIFWKIRRWKANEWKHKLVYKDSMWSAFCSGLWNHLLKPASI